MRHRKSLTAEMMRKAAIKACQDRADSYANSGVSKAAEGCRACADAIKVLPVILDQVPRLDPEEVAVIDAATRWAEADLNDPVSQKVLVHAVLALRSAKNPIS